MQATRNVGVCVEGKQELSESQSQLSGLDVPHGFVHDWGHYSSVPVRGT